MSSYLPTRPAAARPKPRWRPALEILEDRRLLATFQWASGSEGFFDEVSNWLIADNFPPVSSDRVPGPGDTIRDIFASGTINVRDARTVNRIDFRDHVRIVDGGSLTITSATDNLIQTLLVENGGQFQVQGNGTVVTTKDDSTYAGTIDVGAGATFAFGGFSLSAAGQLVQDGAAFTGAGTFLVGDQLFAGPQKITFNTSMTLPANFVLDGDTGNNPQVLILAGKTVTAGANFTMEGNSGALGGEGKLVVPAGSTFTWEGGSIGGTGGTLEVQDGGALNLLSGVIKTLNDHTLDNAGTMTWSGIGDFRVQGAAVFRNLAGGTFDIQNNVALDLDTFSQVTFENAGLITKTSVGDTTFRHSAFTNSGTIHVAAGKLLLQTGTGSSPTTNTGTIDVDQGAQIVFAPEGEPGLIFGPGSTLTGDGIFRIDLPPFSKVRVTADLTVPNLVVEHVGFSNELILEADLTATNFTFAADDGLISGPGDLTVTGLFLWTAGQFAQSDATVNVAPGATLEMRGSLEKTLIGRTLNVFGTANWKDAGRFILAGTLFVRPGGMFHIENDAKLDGGGSSPVIRNQGTLMKEGGVNKTEVHPDIPIRNEGGVLEVRTGTFDFRADGNTPKVGVITQTGGMTRVLAGARLEVGTLDLLGGTLEASGTVVATTVVRPAPPPPVIVLPPVVPAAEVALAVQFRRLDTPQRGGKKAKRNSVPVMIQNTANGTVGGFRVLLRGLPRDVKFKGATVGGDRSAIMAVGTDGRNVFIQVRGLAANASLHLTLLFKNPRNVKLNFSTTVFG